MDRQVNEKEIVRIWPIAGFTLVELMIALAVGSIILGAVMAVFLSQHNTYLAQGQVVEMQQNARLAMNMMASDIRSAGYDPNNLGAGITVAGAQNLSFTRDNGAGVLQTISYSLVDAFAAEARNDGVVDDLGRDEGAGAVPVAENVSQLEFSYLDSSGVPTAVLGDIRSIQVSAFFQSAQAERESNPSRNIYTTPAGAQWQAPVGFWNLYLTTTVQCRNLGL